MSGIGSVILLGLIVALGTVGAVVAESASFYVATNGNDAWSGKLKAPNKGGTDGPFATLERAKSAVRDYRKSQAAPGPVTVYLRKGTYFHESPFILTPEDSGTADGPVSYEACKGEKVTISGGKIISGFREAEINGRKMMAVDLPQIRNGKWYFRQLFVGDQRRSRTRLPKNGYYHVAQLIGDAVNVPWQQGQDSFIYSKDDIRPWRNPNDIDIVALHFWIESRMHIKSVDESAHTVSLDRPSKFKLVSDTGGEGARYYIENVSEALDTPGQWYLSRNEGRLYYYPYTGEDIEHEQFIAPVLERLIQIVGSKDKSIEYVSFKNLIFAHAEHTLPSDSAGSPQAAVDVPGAVYFENAKHCSLSSCEIAQIGTYAVEVGPGCANTDIRNNRIHDMGAGGVKIHPNSEYTTVADNEISDGGKLFPSGVGVWIGNSPHNRIQHNLICDMYYTGVSVGWVWGYGESKAIDNIIEYNRIARIGRGVLSDLGGIYTLGVSPGTILRNNLISDCISYTYGGWGIYTDEGSTNILIENNIVYNTKTGGFHQHYGKENTVRNNIFAFSKQWQIQRSREEEHSSFTFDHNIIYFNEGDLLGSNWGNDHYKIDYNIYWNAANKPFNFAGANVEDWRKRGHDEHSRIVDPLFVNPQKDNFALKPDSPALKLGFKPINISSVGPRGPVGPRK